MKYAIFNPNDGYMCEDEDRIGGYSYDHETDEFTIRFDSVATAKLNCGSNEIIVMLENNFPVGVVEFKRMTKEEINRVYGKVLP
jgi:hypothetical protein